MEEEEFGRRSKNLEDIEGADKLKRVVMKKVSLLFFKGQGAVMQTGC